MADKILIVDDDPDTVGYIRSYLRSQGFETVEAYEGVSALELAHERHPDLIVLDVMMPGMDGFEVARSIRRHPDTTTIPILMFTAKSQEHDKLTGYNIGVDFYLTKPAHPAELIAHIKALLAQSKARKIEITHTGYVVGVIAAKGGLGVSTVAQNLAIAYSRITKKNVIAMETRPGQSTWRDELALPYSTGLDQLLKMNPAEINQSKINEQLTPLVHGIRFLLASNDVFNSVCILAVHQFEAILNHIRGMADLIVVDIGTNFHPAYDVLTSSCNEMIMITEPQPLSLRLTRHLIANLKHRNFGSGKALTLVNVNRIRADVSIPASKIEEILEHSVSLGFIPAPEQAYLSADRCVPISHIQPEGIIARQFDLLVDSILRHI